MVNRTTDGLGFLVYAKITAISFSISAFGLNSVGNDLGQI